MKSKTSASSFSSGMFLSLFLFCGVAMGQSDRIASLPDAPGMLHTESDSSSSTDQAAQAGAVPQNAPAQSAAAYEEGKQTKRILGIFPNFRAVSANVHLPPQSVKEKFVTASQDSFDYSSILIPAAVAGYDQLKNNTPEFHQGAAGYGRYFWHSFLDQTSENYFVEFIVPTITREDTRYYTLGSGGFLKRAGYSLSRAVITRNDAGHETFNISEVVGAGAAAGISNLYYPQAQRTFSNTAGQWGQNIGIDAVTFLAHEFWPDINHALFHGAN